MALRRGKREPLTNTASAMTGRGSELRSQVDAIFTQMLLVADKLENETKERLRGTDTSTAH